MNNNTKNNEKDSLSPKNKMAETNNTSKNKKQKCHAPAARQTVFLEDSEEIQVISLIPHVSYLDKRTLDLYEWEEAGHVEYMTFETLKDLWRNNKGYFRNLWLKPMDDRVLIKFGLVNIYENYDFLMDESNYTKDNISKITASITRSHTGMKFAIINKIKQLVADGVISDISVIKILGDKLDTDFFVFI